MADYFLAEIRIFPYNFAPQGWAFCSGQILAISQNTALFSLIGTYYGGNGTSNFALPDLRGAVPLHVGGGSNQGPGLSTYQLGEVEGTSTVDLLTSQMPSHSHQLTAFVGRGGAASAIPAAGSALTVSSGGELYATSSPNNTMDPSVLSATGGSAPHNNQMPYLGLNFCIALTGIFPARN
jgi:microcystin-dependent protein